MHRYELQDNRHRPVCGVIPAKDEAEARSKFSAYLIRKRPGCDHKLFPVGWKLVDLGEAEPAQRPKVGCKDNPFLKEIAALREFNGKLMKAQGRLCSKIQRQRVAVRHLEEVNQVLRKAKGIEPEPKPEPKPESLATLRLVRVDGGGLKLNADVVQMPAAETCQFLFLLRRFTRDLEQNIETNGMGPVKG